jgi:hypothetical protein
MTKRSKGARVYLRDRAAADRMSVAARIKDGVFDRKAEQIEKELPPHASDAEITQWLLDDEIANSDDYKAVPYLGGRDIKKLSASEKLDIANGVPAPSLYPPRNFK